MNTLDLHDIPSIINESYDTYVYNKNQLDDYLNTKYGSDPNLAPIDLNAIFNIKQLMNSIDDVFHTLYNVSTQLTFRINELSNINGTQYEMLKRLDYIETRMKIFGFMYDDEEQNKIKPNIS